MRGDDAICGCLFSYIDLDKRIRADHPLLNDYFTKGMDGRIDDANAGWKGPALWTTYATRTMFHLETGKGTGRALPAPPRSARRLS